MASIRALGDVTVNACGYRGKHLAHDGLSIRFRGTGTSR